VLVFRAKRKVNYRKCCWFKSRKVTLTLQTTKGIEIKVEAYFQGPSRSISCLLRRPIVQCYRSDCNDNGQVKGEGLVKRRCIHRSATCLFFQYSFILEITRDYTVETFEKKNVRYIKNFKVWKVTKWFGD
jgi:hypothetical protein